MKTSTGSMSSRSVPDIGFKERQWGAGAGAAAAVPAFRMGKGSVGQRLVRIRYTQPSMGSVTQ